MQLMFLIPLVYSINFLTPHQHTCHQLSSTPVYKPVTHYTPHIVAVDTKSHGSKRPAPIRIRSCSIASQIHVVSTNTAMSLHGTNYTMSPQSGRPLLVLERKTHGK